MSDGNDMAPVSKPAEPTVTTSVSSTPSSKPEGQPKVVDSAAKVRLQLELPK